MTSQFLDQILASAKVRGLDQAELARRAGLRPETVSRAKRRGTLDLSSLEALAGAAGLKVALLPADGPEPVRPQQTLKDARWGLAWSNPSISPAALVRGALKHGGFEHVLQAALEFGLEDVKAQAQELMPNLSRRPQEELSRILRNIERGFADAQA